MCYATSYVSVSFMLQGCGKSVIARQFAELLGYHLEPIMLYQVCLHITFRIFLLLLLFILGKHVMLLISHYFYVNVQNTG